MWFQFFILFRLLVGKLGCHNFCEQKNLKTSNKSKRELTGNNNDFVRNTKRCRLGRVREKVRSQFHQNTGTRSERNLSIVDL